MVTSIRTRLAASISLVSILLIMGCDPADAPDDIPDIPDIPDPPAGFLRFEAISTGPGTICGLTSNELVYCWGSAVDSDRPRLMEDAPRLMSMDVHATWNHLLCGLVESGEAHCNRRGEWVMVDATDSFVEIAAGAANCALTAAGRAYCWTYGTGAGIFAGVLGDGSGGEDGYIEGTPVPVAGDYEFVALASTHLVACGTTVDHSAYCWGQHNLSMQMGDGDPSDAARRVPSRVASEAPFRDISISPFHGCALTPAGAAHCWGAARFGQLGSPQADTMPCPSGDGLCVSRPVPVSGEHSFTQVTTGYYHTCALDHGGRAYCWGANGWGQLGNGRYGGGHMVPAPARVAGDLRFRWLAAGQFHTCGIGMNGATYCWGMNQAGQLGAGLHPGEVRTVPHPIGLAN